MMKWIYVGLLVAVVVAMAISYLGSLHPLFEAVANIHVQLLPFAVVSLIGLLAVRQWGLATVAGMACFALAASLIPYLGAAADADTGNETFRAMQYNIYFGNRDAARIVAHIGQADADIVALHELLPEQWDDLEPFLDDYPYRIAEPLPEHDAEPGGGMALLSKTPLQRVAVSETISPIDRVTLAATVELGGEEVLVIGLHPHASRTDDVKVTLRNVQLDGVAALASEHDLPALVLTDLNIAPTSPRYRSFVQDLGWRDPHRSLGWNASWPSWGGPFGMPIDHVFASNHFVFHDATTGSGGGSDHRSLMVELSLPPSET